MKSNIMAFLIMISFLLIVGRSNGRLIVPNSLFIAPNNPSAFDPNVNSIGLHTADGHILEKDAKEFDQERSPSAKSATDKIKVSFRLSPSAQETKKIESSASNKGKGVFNLLPKGSVTPSGPSPKVNSMVTERRLSTSSNSPGVGH